MQKAASFSKGLRCSIRKTFPKHFVIFTEKHACSDLFLIKLRAISPVTLLKRDSNTYSLVNIKGNF